MTAINVTLAAVRNLAATLAKTDTTALKHTERLGLISEAFGWKTDAFMHAIKNFDALEKPADNLRRSAASVSSRLGTGTLSSRKIDDLVASTLKRPGLIVVGGPNGSGKTTTLLEMSRFFEDSGYPVEARFPGFVNWGGQFRMSDRDYLDVSRIVDLGRRFPRKTYVIEEMRSFATMDAALDLVDAGNVVLAGLAAHSCVTAASTLTGILSEGRDGRGVRGVISQRLVRKVCVGCEGSVCSQCGGRGYIGRQMIADAMTFAAGLPPRAPDRDDIHDGLVADALEAFFKGVVDMSALEREFGETDIERIASLPMGRPVIPGSVNPGTMR
jgi:energy-coupling factor transporter ATP-binding protein EcfA2|nr:hypothetical protein [Neorhizobium tomejilense]